MTQNQNIVGSFLVVVLLPLGFLAVNPYGVLKVSAINEQKIDIKNNVKFLGELADDGLTVDANLFSFSSDKTGTAGVRIEFGAPVDLYKDSIVLFARCIRGQESLKLTLIDHNNLTTAYNVVEPVVVDNRWTKVVITAECFNGVWNIDKSRIVAVRLTTDQAVNGDVRMVEIKNVALRAVARYNQKKPD